MLAVIFYASDSDKAHVTKITKELYSLRILFKEHMLSAHKVPELILPIINEYNESDKNICFITVAGRSNALSGLIAANTQFPVIACPPFSSEIDFLLNINSSLMMPSEVPVMTIVDPKNAALALARIFGLGDKDIQGRIKKRIADVKKKFKQ